MWTYTYDANGNMDTRANVGTTYTLTYDQENRLTGMTGGGVNGIFVYYGDGNRVKGTIAGVTTVYIGNYFEWTGAITTMKKYYYQGSTRVAIRTAQRSCRWPGSNNPLWLFGDHLGSTSVVISYDGLTKNSEQMYKPWGEKRYPTGAPTVPTTYQYTGQRHEKDMGPAGGEGLYYYGARWYDPLLGRFSSPDTVIPEQSQGVQAWDRYAYTNNNPVNYTDPSGHWTINGWDDSYLQKQNGNTCAVVSVAIVFSIMNGRKYTQESIQPYFSSTYIGIGVIPNSQARGINNLYANHGINAISTSGSRKEILENLNRDLPVIVTLALPWSKGVGHALVAIGYDPKTDEILFFNPASGKIETESEILRNYNFNRNFTSFDELWAASNGLLGDNDMVVIEQILDIPDSLTPPINSGSSGGGSKGQKALCL